MKFHYSTWLVGWFRLDPKFFRLSVIYLDFGAEVAPVEHFDLRGHQHSVWPPVLKQVNSCDRLLITDWSHCVVMWLVTFSLPWSTAFSSSTSDSVLFSLKNSSVLRLSPASSLDSNSEIHIKDSQSNYLTIVTTLKKSLAFSKFLF